MRRPRTLLLLFIFIALCAATPLMNSQQAAPHIRVAIVGLTHGHVQGFLDQLPQHSDVDLVGIAEPDVQLQHKYQKMFQLPDQLFFTDTETMLRQRHPQAVLVYTSIAQHRAVIEQAAAHGIASMVEKPLATTMQDALAIRQASRQHNVPVLVNYETTWYSSNRAAYDMVQQGKLGTLRKVVVRDGHRGPIEIGVPPEFLKWLTDPAQNGAGALFDFGCYGADLMTWLMHGQPPLTVTAVTQTLKPDKYPHVDDDATVVLTYPHANAILQPSWNWPFDVKDMAIYGSKGYVVTVKLGGLRFRSQGDPNEGFEIAPSLPPTQDNSLDYLAAVLQGKIKPHGDLSSLDTNLIVMQILDAARTSAQTGRTITLKPLPQ